MKCDPIGLAQRFLLSVVVVASLGTAVLQSSPAAAQWTPEQRDACEADAQRLCGDFYPDVNRITACMQRQPRRNLSPRCRRMFDRRDR
jgi:hypothetical protein